MSDPNYKFFLCHQAIMVGINFVDNQPIKGEDQGYNFKGDLFKGSSHAFLKGNHELVI